MPDAPDVMMCRNELRLGLFAAVDALSAEERAGRSPRAVTDWALDEAPEGLAETRGALSAEQQRDLEPYLTIIEAYQELARRLFYIGRPYSTDRTLPWETRLLWDFISASARDTYETTRSVALLSALGMDAPAKTLLRHQMELYGRLLVVLRDPEQQRAYLAALQRLRDMQMAETDTAEDDLRTIALVGGPLMDRLASIEQNLDADDHQSHYDLGVAFKEMGLLDEAIAEFQKALRSPEGRLRTSEALGTAFFDKGQFGIAETVLRRAVDTEAGGDEAKIGLLYWLGRASEAQGKAPEALRCYERALAVDIRFMDLGERVPRLAAERHA